MESQKLGGGRGGLLITKWLYNRLVVCSLVRVQYTLWQMSEDNHLIFEFRRAWPSGIPAIMCPDHQVSQRSCVLAIRYPSDHVFWPSCIPAIICPDHQVSQWSYVLTIRYSGDHVPWPSGISTIMCPVHQAVQRSRSWPSGVPAAIRQPSDHVSWLSGSPAIICPGRKATRRSGVMCPGYQASRQAARPSDGLAFRQTSNQEA